MCIGEHTLFSVYSANHINPFVDNWIHTADKFYTFSYLYVHVSVLRVYAIVYACLQACVHRYVQAHGQPPQMARFVMGTRLWRSHGRYSIN